MSGVLSVAKGLFLMDKYNAETLEATDTMYILAGEM